VSATLSVGGIILLESALSFLGLGIQPPHPSWGSMLQTAQTYIRDTPLPAVYPGVLILLTVVTFNFIGDGLRDAFDPRQTIR
jgi:peptide/nickel transport system permease protein